MSVYQLSPEAEKELLNTASSHYVEPILRWGKRDELIELVKNHFDLIDKGAGEELTGCYEIIFAIRVIPSDPLQDVEG